MFSHRLRMVRTALHRHRHPHSPHSLSIFLGRLPVCLAMLESTSYNREMFEYRDIDFYAPLIPMRLRPGALDLVDIDGAWE